MDKRDMGDVVNEMHEKAQIRKDEVRKKIDSAEQRADDFYHTHFPSFRLKTSLIVSGFYIFLSIFGFILDSISIAQGLEIVNNTEAAVFMTKISFLIMTIPFVILNLIIYFMLKPVHKILFSFFNDKRSISEEKAYSAIKQFDKMSFVVGMAITILFILSNLIGFATVDSGIAGFFFIASRITLSCSMVLVITTCLNLFVRRRLLYIIDMKEIKEKLNVFQTRRFQNVVIPLILILNAMLLFSDVSIRITDSTSGRLEQMKNRANEFIGSDSPDVARLSETEITPSELPGLNTRTLESGYLFLIFILFSQALMLYVFLFILQYRQMKDLKSKLSDLSAGSGDLTQQITILEMDDFAEIVTYVNRFVKNLKNKLITVEESSNRVGHSSEILLKELETSSAVTEEMVASVQQISRTTQNRTQVVKETSDNIRKMIDSLEKINGSVQTQAGFVEQTSSSVNEMAASINSVTESTQKANQLSEQLSEAASAGGDAVKNSIQAVREVENSSEEVNNLVSTITRIAAQTNLLAMNAAIEAAHAGDAGRGFAVVAEEVRNLAESSSNSAKLITAQIKNMVNVVNNGVQMSENAGEALNRVLGYIGETTQLINGIALAMDEQNTGATEILKSITSLVEATQVIKQVSREEMDMNEEMKESVNQVIQAFEEIKEATEEQSAGTREMMSSVEQLKAVASENESVVKILSGEFSGFKLS